MAPALLLSGVGSPDESAAFRHGVRLPGGVLCTAAAPAPASASRSERCHGGGVGASRRPAPGDHRRRRPMPSWRRPMLCWRWAPGCRTSLRAHGRFSALTRALSPSTPRGPTRSSMARCPLWATRARASLNLVANSTGGLLTTHGRSGRGGSATTASYQTETSTCFIVISISRGARPWRLDRAPWGLRAGGPAMRALGRTR